jgi:hypothetical protein
LRFVDVPRSPALRGIAESLRNVHHPKRADGAFFFVWPVRDARLGPGFRFIRIRSPRTRDQRRTSLSRKT